MNKCPYCGLENPDEAVQCVTCHTALAMPPETLPPEVKTEYQISPQESRFWERMSFRPFAVLMVRLQALWLLFYAVLDLTYLPRYLSRWFEGSTYPSVAADLKREVGLAIFRIALHVAAAVAIILYAERLLSWLVKDWVAKQPNPPQEPMAGAAGSDVNSNIPGGGSRGSAST